MSPEDVALCQQAIELANSGQTQAAYEQFCAIHNRGNPEDVTLLYWIAITTPRREEAQRARDTIARIEPDHPELQALQAYIAQKQVSPLPPRRKHSCLIVGCSIGIVGVVLLFVYMLLLVKLTPVGVTDSELSKTPLVEQGEFGDYDCWVITKDDTDVLVLLINHNSNTVYRDCMTFMRQVQDGGYYSAPRSPSVSGLILQCKGYGADKTYWQVLAPQKDLITDTICHDLKQILLPTQR